MCDSRNEIMNSIVKELKELVNITYGDSAKVIADKVFKVNVTYHSISIIEANILIAPIFYIDTMIDSVISGEYTPLEIAESIIKKYSECKKDYSIPLAVEKIIKDADSEIIKKHLKVYTINADNNQELLSTCKHKKFLDLAMICKICVPCDDSDNLATVLVTNNLFERVSISEEEMFDVALNNTMTDVTVKGMSEVLAKMGVPVPASVVDELMYVISCGDNCGGTMLYTKNGIKDLANKINKDLYILPSSINEVICVPIEGGNYLDLDVIKGFKDMVESINRTEVPLDEVLSDNVYIYSRKDDNVTMC